MTRKHSLLLSLIMFLSAVTYSAEIHFPEQMVYHKDHTTFTMPLPVNAKGITLRIYKEGQGGLPVKTVDMKQNSQGFWQATVKGDLKGMFYTFERKGEGLGQSPGIFAKAVGVNGDRAAIIDLATTDPEGWQADDPITLRRRPTVIYEMHHRDFSIDPEAGFRYPGKFLALTEDKAINHLKELGITAVHILPSFDFASIDETRLDQPQYNWGYDPKNYNVPEGSYSTDPYDPATRITEFKRMVQTLHNAGIRVIMDVVYNHTYDIKNSNFNRLYPGEFYRMRADGTPSDGSGCGNETASEREHVRQFIRQSVLYWVNEYHIDGFRFDLMGIHDLTTMKQIREDLDAIDPNILVYGEGWSAGACGIDESQRAVKANVGQLPGIAVFSDELRDALRGPFNDDHKAAFLGGVPGNCESIKFGIVGGVEHSQVDMDKVNYTKVPWAKSPKQMISYVSCHDDMCLTDRLRTSIPGITEDELIRLDLLAQTAVFTSQGIPFIQAGEELLRTKLGVHNSYNSPDSVNLIRWANKERYPQVFDYYRGLIKMRTELSEYFEPGEGELNRRVVFHNAPKGVVVYCIEYRYGQSAIRKLYVVLNANKTTYQAPVTQSGPHRLIARNGKFMSWFMNDRDDAIEFVNIDSIVVAPQSALILEYRDSDEPGSRPQVETESEK